MEALSAAAAHVRGGVEEGPAHVRRQEGGSPRKTQGVSLPVLGGSGREACGQPAPPAYRVCGPVTGRETEANWRSNCPRPLVIGGRVTPASPWQLGFCLLYGMAPRVRPLTIPET